MCADVFTAEKRSEVMARIRGSGNASTELRLISLMRVAGIKGWRRNHKLLGRPDFVFRNLRVAVFVDGDFWHGHPTRAKIPSTNSEFWRKKITANQARDRVVDRELKKVGWTPLRLWEGDLRRNPRLCISRLKNLMRRRSRGPAYLIQQ